MNSELNIKSNFWSVLLLTLSLVTFQGCLFGADDDHDDHSHFTNNGDNVSGMHAAYTAVVTIENSLVIGDNNELKLAIKDSDGNAVVADSAWASTWMPMHNHGSTPNPMVHDMGMGMYHIMNINITMDGEWEVKVNVMKGDVTDMFTFKFDVDA